MTVEGAGGIEVHGVLCLGGGDSEERAGHTELYSLFCLVL